MKTYLVRLKPKSSVSSIPASDTLFGALCWGIRALYGENRLEDVLRQFVSGSPPFVLSSAFPLHVSGERFFPFPVLKGLEPSAMLSIAGGRNINGSKRQTLFDTIAIYKNFSKARFISQELLGALLTGKADEAALFTDHINGSVVVSNGFMFSKSSHSGIRGEFFSHDIRVRTMIDRYSGSTTGVGEMFHSSNIYIGSEFSLFFLLKTDDISLLEPLAGNGKFLSDNGIGGERSVGVNHYDLTLEEADDMITGTGSRFMTLSRYIPVTSEIDRYGKDISYNVIPNVSRVDNSLDFQGERFVKNRLFQMQEGSVFNALKHREYYGRVVEACRVADKTIYHYGLAFPLFYSS